MWLRHIDEILKKPDTLPDCSLTKAMGQFEPKEALLLFVVNFEEYTKTLTESTNECVKTV